MEPDFRQSHPQHELKPQQVFKIYVAGDTGIGKRTFLKQFQAEEQKIYCNMRYHPPVKVHFLTNHGPVVLEFHRPVNGGFSYASRNMFGMQAAILMFDLTSRITYKNLPMWRKELTHSNDDILPMVAVGNKAESLDRKVKSKNLGWIMKKNLPYYQISAKANYQLEDVCMCLLRQLLTDTVVLIEPIRLKEPMLTIDEKQLEALENEWKSWPTLYPSSDDEF